MPIPKTPLLAVDCAVFEDNRCALLIVRKNPPFQGQFALPGGFVEVGETVENACRRELFEETGLTPDRLQLLGVYSDPDRDPRGHVCSVVFAARMPHVEPVAGDDASAANWIADWRDQQLAFDHRNILEDAALLLFGR